MPYVPKLQSYKRQGIVSLFLRRSLIVLIYFVLFSLFIRAFFLDSLRISSDSMAPTISKNEHLLISPLPFGKEAWFGDGTWLDLANPSRNNVILLVPPDSPKGNILTHLSANFVSVFGFFLPETYKRSFTQNAPQRPIVRRVLGLPGDTVRYSNGQFFVKFANTDEFIPEKVVLRGGLAGSRLPTKLPSENSGLLLNNKDIILGKGEFYVVADNRFSGLDSRHWGPVHAKDFRGLVLLRLWPLTKFGVP